MEDECEHVLNHICIADQVLKNNPPFEFSLWLLLCWTFWTHLHLNKPGFCKDSAAKTWVFIKIENPQREFQTFTLHTDQIQPDFF